MRNDKVREEYRRTLENLHKPGYLARLMQRFGGSAVVGGVLG